MSQASQCRPLHQEGGLCHHGRLSNAYQVPYTSRGAYHHVSLLYHSRHAWMHAYVGLTKLLSPSENVLEMLLNFYRGHKGYLAYMIACCKLAWQCTVYTTQEFLMSLASARLFRPAIIEDSFLVMVATLASPISLLHMPIQGHHMRKTSIRLT